VDSATRLSNTPPVGRSFDETDVDKLLAETKFPRAYQRTI
jgi:hypothetical protein